ncbi:MAG TPA: hypothetical protein VGL81_14490 [Polyangiaceae bacterium]
MQVSCRVPSGWVQRAEAIAERLQRDGFKSDKASVYRAALQRGLDDLEKEFGGLKSTRGKR